MTHVPDSDLRELEGLLGKATPGPWVSGVEVWGLNRPPDEFRANAALIVAAVNALPNLLSDLREARERIGELENTIDALREDERGR